MSDRYEDRLLKEILEESKKQTHVAVEGLKESEKQTHLSKELLKESEKQTRLLQAIRDALKPTFPIRGLITQGDNMVTGTILGLIPGQSDTFFVTPVDVNGNADALPVGSPVPTFNSDDATVTLTPAADGLSVVAQAAAGATPGGSFNLNWNASYTDPQNNVVNITATANVPYLAPPVLLPVGGVISQGAPATAGLKAGAVRR